MEPPPLPPRPPPRPPRRPPPRRARRPRGLRLVGGILGALAAISALGFVAFFLFTFVCCVGVSAIPHTRDPGITYREAPPSRPEVEPPAVLSCEVPTSLARTEAFGSAVDLVDEQLTVVAFAELEGGARWTEADKTRALKTLDEAHRWLESEAGRHGRSLRLRRRTLPGPTRLSKDELPALNAPIPLRTLRAIDAPLRGARANTTWRHAFLEEEQVDGAHLMVMVRGSGRSFATTYIGGDELWLDPSFLFVGHPRGPEWEIAVIAHEILHNYGADDLYVEPTRSGSDTTLTPAVFPEVHRRWPDSIMIKTASYPHRIDKYVDPFTAWQIGWSDCADEALFTTILKNQI